jgi:probable rRNA maturation factor
MMRPTIDSGTAMIDVVNLQRKIKLETELYRVFSKTLADAVPEANGRVFSIAFVSDSRMRQLNELFRSKNATTDVLSFPYQADAFDPDKTNLGDIVISAEQAEKQAAENGLTIEGEIKQLILHGLLHLCGFDHATDGGEMNARELELRDMLGI